MRTHTVTSCSRSRTIGRSSGSPDDARDRDLAELVRRPWTFPTAGERLTVRPSSELDLAAVACMHRRCSAHSLLDRYRAGGRPPAVIALDRQLRGPLTFVAETAGGSIVALGVVTRDARHSPTSAEVGIIVEDGWQRLGIATELMSHLAGAAVVAGFAELIGYPGPEFAAAQRLMIGIGRTRMTDTEDMHLHTNLSKQATLGLGPVRERLAS